MVPLTRRRPGESCVLLTRLAVWGVTCYREEERVFWTSLCGNPLRDDEDHDASDEADNEQ